MEDFKKQADNLVEEYYQLLIDTLEVNSAYFYCKQCALISINREIKLLEKLNEKLENLDNMNLTVFSIVDYNLEDLQKIKDELLKM